MSGQSTPERGDGGITVGESSSRPLDLYRLGQFLTVAAHSGFTRAAAELHLSQQALSASVRELERQIGTPLFERSGRRVVLTAAGRAFVDGGPVLLAAARTLTRQAQEAVLDRTRPFVVGHSPAITSDEVFDLVESRIGDAPFTAVQLFPDRFTAALHDGSVDIVLRRGVATPADLAAAVIAYHPVRIAVADDHPLAARECVAIRELRDERVIVWGPPGSSFYTDFILGTCRRAGFEPRIAVNAIQGTPPVTAALAGGIAFVTAPSGPAVGGRVIVVDLRDPPMAPTQALWLPNTVSAVRDLLISETHNQPL